MAPLCVRCWRQKKPRSVAGAGFLGVFRFVSIYLDTCPQPAPPLVIRSTSTRVRRSLPRSCSNTSTAISGRVRALLRWLLRCDMSLTVRHLAKACQPFSEVVSLVTFFVRPNCRLDGWASRCFLCDVIQGRNVAGQPSPVGARAVEQTELRGEMFPSVQQAHLPAHIVALFPIWRGHDG